jgi:hypothetical protein
VSLLIPAAEVALPLALFFHSNLAYSTRAQEVIAGIDGSTTIELVRQLGEPNRMLAIGIGLAGGLLSLFLIAPAMAGMTVAAAAANDERLKLRRLFVGAGEFYARMLRTSLVGLVPLGAGGVIAWVILRAISKANQRATWETLAHARLGIGILAGALAVFLFHLLVDEARAHFAADPSRRSAVLALWAAVRLLVRRPVCVITLGALGTGIAFLIPAVLMALRLQVNQDNVWRISIAWLFAQGAHLAVGWGRGARIFGFAELARADAADRVRRLEVKRPVNTSQPEAPQHGIVPPEAATSGDREQSRVV